MAPRLSEPIAQFEGRFAIVQLRNNFTISNTVFQLPIETRSNQRRCPAIVSEFNVSIELKQDLNGLQTSILHGDKQRRAAPILTDSRHIHICYSAPFSAK